MAGIKIHQYPLERTSIGDEDYYDIDYYTGSGYQSAKIKGSTLKNVLGANYIDITSFISGYDLTDKDAGKLITNSNANVRTLVIPSGLALPNNMITVKGRIGIQPETGVNITLPDGSTITEPTQFTCEADEVYILHKSAFTGDDYILVSLKKSENIGTNDLIISDAVRELQVATDGTFQIVTNDANNSAIFKVGENSNERFSGVELNSVTFEQTIAEPNPTNNGAGVLVDINPNEFGIEGRSDIGDSGTKRNRLYFSPNEVIFEKANAGKLTFNSLGSVNTFEDLRATKKGIEYSADYSANFSVRSLVDKGYVDSKPDTNLSNSNLTQTDANRTYDIGTGNRTLKFLSGANEKVNFHTDGGNPTIEAFKRNSGPAIKVNKVSGAGNAFEVVGGDTLLERQLELNSVTNGFLMNRVTTLQMNSIATPSTNELVFNTDLNGLYRYNGSSWVALSSGYGIIGVYSGSGNGTPVFFADLQSALETCKASGGYFTVKLYSNITITTAIEIDYTGSGVGKSYLFRQLTIDFNGFSVTNAQANTTDAFTLQLSNSASVYQEVRLINGNIIRTNGTGTHRAIKCNQSGRVGILTMSAMNVYCENGTALAYSLETIHTSQRNINFSDLGGSKFVSLNSYALDISTSGVGNRFDLRNFSAVSYGSVETVYINIFTFPSSVSNFTCENLGTGIGLNALGVTATVFDFTTKSNSGTALYVTTAKELYNFTAISVSGFAVDIQSFPSCTINNFTAITGNERCFRVAASFDNSTSITNGKCVNNSSNYCFAVNNPNVVHNIEVINLGSGIGAILDNFQGSRGEITNCKFASIGGIAGELYSSSGHVLKISNSSFTSHWNNSGGHAVRLMNTSTVMLSNCHFNVRNSGANVINSTVARTLKSFGNTHNEVASTPINANVTLSTLANF
jgi:hypothetical protein